MVDDNVNTESTDIVALQIAISSVLQLGMTPFSGLYNCSFNNICILLSTIMVHSDCD